MKSSIAAIISVCLLQIAHADEVKTLTTNYLAVATEINTTLRAHLYDPSELETPGYKRVEAAVAALAETVTTDEAFIEGFQDIWKDGPFSHVELRKAQQSADDLAVYLDTLRIGGGGATLHWVDKFAILTVNTMMGLDTIEEIDAAYLEIANRETHALVIDMRENAGGAFAIRPLVAHLLDTKTNIGGFVAQRWFAEHHRAPTAAELEAAEPWEGWSIQAFWADVQDNKLTGLSFTPTEPVFAGPVYLLTSHRTASAAELATDALKSTGRAKVIGENTAGQMLSQKIFDIPGGFHLSLPIADYYSIKHGRIEGVGIEPDIATDAQDALNTALEQR